MTKEIYSELKIIHDLDRIRSLREGKDFFPRCVRIDLTTKCNHNCAFCLYQNANRGLKGIGLNENMPRREDINHRRLIKLIKEFEECGVESIVLVGGGEPTLHPHFDQIMTALADSTLEFGLITNGARLPLVRRYSRAKGFRWIRVSLDAATPGTWQKLHRPVEASPHFDAILDSLAALAADAKEPGSNLAVGGSFIISDENHAETAAFCHLGKSLGLNNVRVGIEYGSGKACAGHGISDLKKAVAGAKHALEDETYRIYDNWESRLHDISRTAAVGQKCHFQSLTTTLGADLNFYTCCFGKYTESFRIGSAATKSFRDLWLKTRKRFLSRFSVTKCPPCWYVRQNNILGYMADPCPTHVKFVA